MNPLHSAKTDQWYTPIEIIRLVHETIGYPDLDPASSEAANLNVNARRYLTEGGIEGVWFDEGSMGSVFLNPPGGKKGNQSVPALFWRRLMNECSMGYVTHSIFLGFSLEFLQVHQGYHEMLDGALICIPKKRIRFVSPDGSKSPKSPTHSNCIIYTPGLLDHSYLFRQHFGEIGLVLSLPRLT